MLSTDEVVHAAVSWEQGTQFLTEAAPALHFGRGGDCAVRLGHQPVADSGVPRTAGRILVLPGGRTAVENLAERRALDITYEDDPVEAVRPGSLYSPPADRFEIQVGGSTRVYVIKVHSLVTPVRVSPRPSGLDSRDPITRLDPSLTERQWRILATYTAPLRAGRAAPSTHAEVAASLNWSLSLIRLECAAIWNEFVLAGIPMRDYPDKRDAIVDAAIRHRLSAPECRIP